MDPVIKAIIENDRETISNLKDPNLEPLNEFLRGCNPKEVDNKAFEILISNHFDKIVVLESMKSNWYAAGEMHQKALLRSGWVLSPMEYWCYVLNPIDRFKIAILNRSIEIRENSISSNS